mgnify:FL=1
MIGRPPVPIPLGTTYHRLRVLGRALRNDTRHGVWWDCRCECGTVLQVLGGDLRRGQVKLCGCLHREQSALNSLRHGHATNTVLATGGSRTYHSWQSMMQRCYKQKLKQYKDYGGRGISVTKPWRDSFESFLNDMGERPVGTSIDRIDNRFGYFLANCRWATPKQQAMNRRSSRHV